MIELPARFLLIAALAGAYALWRRREGDLWVPSGWVLGAAGTYAAAAAISSIAHTPPGGVDGTLAWLSWPMLAWIAGDAARRPWARRPAVRTGAAIGALIALTAFAAWLSGARGLQPYTVDGEGRLTWPLEHPSLLGLAMAAALPFALVGIARTRGVERILFGAGGALALAALIATLSRGAFLAMLAAALVLALAGVAKRTILVGVGVVIAAALPVLVARFTAPDAGLGNARIDIWRNALDLIAQNPFTGVGLQRFEDVADPHESGGVLVPTQHGHDLVLGFSAETGLLGGAAILMLLALGLAAAWSVARHGGHDPSGWDLAFASSFVAIAVWSVLDYPFLRFGFTALFWIVLGALLGIESLLRRDLPTSSVVEAGEQRGDSLPAARSRLSAQTS